MASDGMTKKCLLCGRDNPASEESCKECGRGFSPSRVSPMYKFGDELPALLFLLLSLILVCLVGGIALMGVGEILQGQVADVRKPGELRATERARFQVLRELRTFSVDQPKIEFRNGGNLDVYLSQRAYDSVPFPDRPPAVERVGQGWCVSQSQTFFPAVRLRDERTGATFASYSCVFGRVSVETP